MKIRTAAVAVAVLAAAIPIVSRAKTVTVGAGKQYATPADGFDHISNGDVVEIDEGTWKGADVIKRVNQSNITVRGAGIGKTVFDADGEGGNGGRGMFVVGNTSGCTFEGITFTGESQDTQAAVYGMATGSVTFRNCRFENSSYCFYIDSASTAEYYFENCEFQLGDRGDLMTKNEIAKLSLVNCKIDSAGNGKDAVTSKARTTIISGCTFDEVGGKNSVNDGGRSRYEVYCPNGGDVVISGTLLRQSDRTGNAAMVMIGDTYSGSTLTWYSDNTLDDKKNNKDPDTQFDELVVRSANCALVRRDPVTVEVTWSAGSDYDPASWKPSASNAVFGVTATGSPSYYTRDTNFNLVNDLATLTDGRVPTTFETGYPDGIGLKSGDLTFAFDKPSALRELRFFTFWKDGGRDGIRISRVVAATAGGSVTLIDREVSFGLGNNDTSGHLTLSLVDANGGVMLDGVTSVTVSFPGQDNDGTGYVEVEAICDEEWIGEGPAQCTARGASAADGVFTLTQTTAFRFTGSCTVRESRGGVDSDLGVFAAGATATVFVSKGETVTWTVSPFDDSAPYIAMRSATPNPDGTVTIAYALASTGGQASVDLTARVWLAEADESTARTETIPGAAAGERTFVVSGLMPNRDYKFRISAPGGNDPLVLSARTSAPPPAGDWQVGVWQRKVATSGGEDEFDTGFTNTVFDVPAGRGEWERHIEYGTLMAYTTGDWNSTFTGIRQWWNNNSSFIYEGYVRLSAGSYYLHTSIDDTAYLEIDGNVVHNVTKYTKGAESNFSLDATGWHYFKLGVGDYGGGHGPIDGEDNAFYLRLNDGPKQKFFDPWDGSYLRVGMSIGVEDQTASGGVLSFLVDENTAALAGSSSVALKVAFGRRDGGGWASSEWEDKTHVVALNGRRGSFNYSSAGCGVARLFLVNAANGKELFASDLLSLPSSSQAALSASVVADGTPGDKIAFSGSVLSLGQSSSGTIRIYLASAADFSDKELACETQVSSTGVFAAERTTFGGSRIVPGSTYYYRAELSAGASYDEVSGTVTTSAGAAVASTDAASERWNGTFYVTLSDVGAGGSATVYLFTGATAETMTNTSSAVVTGTTAQEMRWEFPFVGEDVCYAFLVSNSCESASWGVWSDAKTLRLVDTTAYYWKAGVESGSWTDRSCWTDESGAALDARCRFPNSPESKVSFSNCSASDSVEVSVSGTFAVHHVVVAPGMSLTLAGAVEGARIDCSYNGSTDAGGETALNLGEGSSVTIDGLYYNSIAYMKPPAGASLRLVNGATFVLKREAWLNNAGSVSVEDGSTFIFIGNHGYSDNGFKHASAEMEFALRDGTLDGGVYTVQLTASASGATAIDLYGQSQVRGVNFRALNENGVSGPVSPEIRFHIPAGGYDAVPVTRISDGTWGKQQSPFGFESNVPLTLVVAKDSPALRSPRSVDALLVEWKYGVDVSKLLLAASPKGVRSRAYFTYGWENDRTTSRRTPESEGELPTGVWVRCESSGTKLVLR